MSGGGSDAANARNTPLLRPEGDTPYSVWRPQMETFLMRANVETRDYKEPIPGWTALVSAVESDAAAEEADALTRLLGGTSLMKDEPRDALAKSSSSSSSADKSSSASSMSEPTPLSTADRKLLTALVNRSRRAYGFLYAAIAPDIRELIADVPQGYAYGLWSLLQRRFESNSDDNIADVWSRYVSLAQEPNEAYDAYMARVDKVTALLKGAGQEPPVGLRKVALLYRLQPMYTTARLALQASKRINEAGTIDWLDVKAYMLDYEREQLRSDTPMMSGDRAMAARTMVANRGGSGGGSSGGTRDRYQGPRDMTQVQCYNCDEYGHISRACTKQRRRRKDAGDGWKKAGGSPPPRDNRNRRGNDRPRGGAESEDDSPRHVAAVFTPGHAFAVVQVNRFRELSSDDDDETEDDSRPVTYAQVAERALAATTATTATKAASATASASSSRTRDRSGTPAAAASPAPASSSSSVASSSPPAAAASSRPAPAAKAAPADQLPRSVPRDYRSNGRNNAPIDEALKEFAWGVDTMASASVTGNRDLLTNMKRVNPIMIKVADGAVIMVQFRGSTKLRLKVHGEDRVISMTLDDIYWHERFDANLISWDTIRRGGWKMHSSSSGTYLTTPKGNKVEATTKGRLTVLETAALPERVYAATAKDKIPKVVCASADELVRMHERFAHVGFDRLIAQCKAQQTDGIGSIDGLSSAQLADAKKRIHECTACIQGKMPRPKFGTRGLDSGRRPGEILHMDTAHISLGNDPSTGKQRHAYWIIMVDPFSEGRFSQVCKSKSEVAGAVVGMITRAQQMTGKGVRSLWCDNGSEFINQHLRAFCKSNRTELRSPPAHTPELRGVAERNVRSFKDCARTMLIHSGAPHFDLWEYAASYQAYLWNRTRIAKATDMTPLEALSGRTPSILHTAVFGCDAWVHQSRGHRGQTFDAKAQAAIYLGHTDAEHGAIVRILSTGKTLRVRDVELRETSFTHMTAYREGKVDQLLSQAYRSSRPEKEYFAPVESSNSRGDAPNADVQRRAQLSRQGGRNGPEYLAGTDSEYSESDEDDLPPAPRPKNATKSQQRPLVDSGNNADGEFDVEKVIDFRVRRNKTFYKVKWVGWDEPTWEPSTNLTNSSDAVNKYLTEHRAKVASNGERVLRSSRANRERPSGIMANRDREMSTDESDVDRPSVSSPAVDEQISSLVCCSRL